VTQPLVDEHAVWRQALDHDGFAFARLFDLHRDAVFRQALRFVDQPADAEEIAAAAFFELWRKRDVVRVVDGSVLPWLLVTAANLARNSRRALLRRETALRRIAADRARDDREIDHLDGQLLRRDLMVALRRLKPQDAALVTMTALEGYPVGEVAALLGVTENAARVRLHRAHKRLRELLDTDSIGARGLIEEGAR
jgi:RNA polymerase sigma-70 factor (ECF subfamily)